MKRVVCAVVVGTLVAAGAIGEDKKVVVGEDMVVTAGRDEREVYKVPANVSTITAEQLQQGSHESVVDALKNLAGVQVRSITGNPSDAEVSMRGFGENSHGRVLVLLDGNRLNRPDLAGINWLQIPVNNVERIEVVRGNGTVLYGDNALAGVINVITRKGQADPSVSIAAEAGTFGMNAVRLNAIGSQGALMYSLSADRYETDGYRDNSGFLSWGAGVYAGYAVNDMLGLSLGVSMQDVEYGLPGWLTEAEIAADRKASNSPDDSSKNDYLNTRLGMVWTPAKGNEIDVNFFYGQKEIASDMTSWFSFSDTGIDTLGVMPRYVLDSEIAGHANNLVVGADYYQDRLEVDRFADGTRGLVTTSAEVKKDVLGFYLRDEFSITDSLLIGAGARMETAKIEGSVNAMGASLVDDDTRHNVTACEVSLLKVLEKNSKVFTRFGTVYRYPFVDEQISYIGFGADQFYADIDPEEGWNAEVGGTVPLAEKVTAEVTLFWLEMEDEIAWNNMAVRNENLDKTRRRGVEFSLSYLPVDAVEVGLNYTYTEAVFMNGENEDNDIPLVPGDKASAFVTVHAPMGTAVTLTGTYTGDAYIGGDYANIRPMLDDYIVVDLLIRHVSSSVPGLSAHVAVDNVLNEKYASLGYVGWMADGYYPSPETGVRAGLAYSF